MFRFNPLADPCERSRAAFDFSIGMGSIAVQNVTSRDYKYDALCSRETKGAGNINASRAKTLNVIGAHERAYTWSKTTILDQPRPFLCVFEACTWI